MLKLFGFGKKKEQETVEEKAGWLSRLRRGLSKTSNVLGSGITGIFTKRKLDAETLEELEDLLISADLGIAASAAISKKLKTMRLDKEITDEEIRLELAQILTEILKPVEKLIELEREEKPRVLLICGVNGNGKTTTIGKLAHMLSQNGKKVIVAACDTFRAAAVEQLNVWATRSGAEIISGAQDSDPASVAYTAYEKARKDGADFLLIDTAGRLQNKANLMEELAKITRVLKKIDDSAPHENIIILDACTGQNAINQVEVFNQTIGLTGLIVTKLDGTAKGGIIIALAEKFGIPIHAIGVGEQIEDFHSFEAEDFAKSIVGL